VKGDEAVTLAERPTIPEHVRKLKARIARFVREELHPFEAEIARRGEIDEEKLEALREKARAAGFSNLNMPEEYGGMDLPVVSRAPSRSSATSCPWSEARRVRLGRSPSQEPVRT
jgi:alkylation response protein AidB-like acyl-CoA dehydrogenase